MMKFTMEQLSVSTAEEESYYFTGQPAVAVRPRPSAILPPGAYRVIEGGLYRIVTNASPTIPGTSGRIVDGSEQISPD